ncbi:MAG: hypothetical protein GDA41_07985 [Rhodospirillales bacterium]|nr:hypothetical protein [Rhodospirillales bacterium]
MPLDRAALIGYAVTTSFGAVINSIGVAAGETIAVIGYGGVDLSAINGAAIAGAGPIVAVDISAEKLATVQQFGATDCVDSSTTDPM